MDAALYDLFQKAVEPFGVEITPQMADKFEKYASLLKEWNEKINLTAITDDEGIIVKHFADSLSIAQDIKKIDAKSLADVGTGAGFPGIPLKILFPELKVTLVDSLAKRITFLNIVISELGLEKIEAIHARAEDAGRMPVCRDHFDVVTARAVAPMPVLLEYCMPLVRTGGHFVAMKGSTPETNFENAAKELSSKLVSSREFSILDGNGEQNGRRVYIFKKIAATSKKYPRKAGVASKSPL